jgi:hypothetical protein
MDYLILVVAHVYRRYSDRQENVGYEVRAGLSSIYATMGWVADAIHSESALRTLDYACLFSLQSHNCCGALTDQRPIRRRLRGLRIHRPVGKDARFPLFPESLHVCS